MKIKKNKSVSSRIILRYCILTAITVLIIGLVLPYVLNYPPESINTDFDLQMSYIAYYQQIALIGFFGLLVIATLIRFSLKDLDAWYKMPDNQKFEDKKLVSKIRKKCFNLPYILFVVELIIPIIIGIVVLFFTGSHYSIMLYKIFFFLVSASLLLALISFVFSKDLYADFLAQTYTEASLKGIRVNLKAKIFMQIIPICLIILLITSLIGYSRAVSEKENIMFDLYSKILSEKFNTNKTYSTKEIVSLLNSIHLYDNNEHKWFIIFPDSSTLTSNNSEISNFIIEYTKQIAPKYNGKTYDSYGVDTQGCSITLSEINGKTLYVGILYDISSTTSLQFFIINFLLLILLAIIVLYMITNSISKDLTTVLNGFKKICDKKDDVASVSKLPVVSNDEIGDLVSAFNNIQDITKDNIDQIHNSQDILIERERLASLGQMIGGIAHNLKTPIMSISGAAEGLSDLIKEYDSSIGDSEVTEQDHHDIAKDMSVWVEKIRDYTGYMSDVITAVKGQAVTLSDEQAVTFSIEELVKRVNILMKHELKNALVELNVDIKVKPSTELNGNINSLVQVVNNMISNAIQSYNGSSDKSIDMIITKEKKEIVIAIKDHGCGLPKEVKEKLFKEMITTKGKNGTGLGLFMSYSNIRAHFNGNITFDSEEGVGTTFYIKLPV